MKNSSAVLFQIVGIAVVALLGYLALTYLLATGPTADKKPRGPQPATVEVGIAAIRELPLRITGMGTVMPAQQTVVTAQVGGTVTWLTADFSDGARVRAGQELARIDDRDYAIALRQAEADVIARTSDLRREQGQQAVAKAELAALGDEVKDIERDLFLRQPQLQSLQAAVSAADARVERARLDLHRTQIAVPFAGLIDERHIDLGANVTPGARLATIVASDRFWVEVLVPETELRWFSAEDVAVKLSNPAVWGDASRVGRVVRVLPGLQQNGRMARVLVAVDKPLDAEPAVRLGAFVSVSFEPRRFTTHVVLQRDWLREHDSVWLVTDNKLQIRQVEVLWRDRDHVVVRDGVEAGDVVVTSALSIPVDGMAVQRAEALPMKKPSASPQESTGSGDAASQPEDDDTAAPEASAAPDSAGAKAL